MEPDTTTFEPAPTAASPWDAQILNILDKRPRAEELEDLDEGPCPEIEDREIEERISHLLKEEEEEADEENAPAPPAASDLVFKEDEEEVYMSDDDDEELRERTEASLWYFIIYEEIQNLTSFTLFWDILQQAAWKKKWLSSEVTEKLSCYSREPATRKYLMKKLLEALDEEAVQPQEVVRAMIESGVPILRKCLQRCWVSIVELFKINQSDSVKLIKEWIHENSPINLNISEETVALDKHNFPSFILALDEFHLCLVLCAIRDALIKKQWSETTVSEVRNNRLIDLFAMARLYYSVCFEPEGLIIRRYSLWSPQCLSHSLEDKGQCTLAFDRGIKLIRNAAEEVLPGPTPYDKDKENFSLPTELKASAWIEKVFAECEEVVRVQNQKIKKLKATLFEQQAIVKELLAGKTTSNETP